MSDKEYDNLAKHLKNLDNAVSKEIQDQKDR
jgi:NAD-dependent DNA ligase